MLYLHRSGVLGVHVSVLYRAERESLQFDRGKTVVDRSLLVDNLPRITRYGVFVRYHKLQRPVRRVKHCDSR